MVITRTFNINDEPMISVSSGKRTAEIKYLGNRYVYAELCNQARKILCFVHSSINPEKEIALERLTPDTDRTIIEIDAAVNPLLASIVTDLYDLSVDDYTENLPNGQIYKYDYPKPNKLWDIFDIHNMIYNKEKNDFDEYKFLINDVSSDEFKRDVNIVISKASESLSTNEYNEEDRKEINKFLLSLEQVIKDIDRGIAHWKIDFPTCDAIKK